MTQSVPTLTLGRFVANPLLRRVELLSGDAAMDRPIVGLRILEPAADAFAPGELLVVPAASGALSEDLLREVAAAGCVGLCLQGPVSMREAAAELLAEAGRHDLAVLYAGEGTSCGDLYEAFYSESAAADPTQSRLDALPAHLTTLVLQGGTLDDVAAAVGKELNVGVIIGQVDGRRWSTVLDDDLHAELLRAGLLDNDGRVHVERSREGLAKTSTGEVRIVDIGSGEAVFARLVVVRRVGAFRAAELVALENVATVAALVITRQQAVSAVEGKYRGDFLRDVFESRAGEPAEVIEHAAGLGWNVDRPMAVVVAHLDRLSPEDSVLTRFDQRTWHDRFALAWQQVLGSQDRSIPVVYSSGEVVVLLPAESSQVRLEKVLKSILALVRGDGGGGRRSFSTGVSRVVTDLRRLPAAYRQALKSLEVGMWLSGPGNLTFFDELGVLRLLAFVPEDELHSFAHEVLGELAEESEAVQDLRETLRSLVETNFNLAETARVQMYHYNTIRHRLLRLKTILGDFDLDARRRLDVSVALQISTMLAQRRREDPSPSAIGWY